MHDHADIAANAYYFSGAAGIRSKKRIERLEGHAATPVSLELDRTALISEGRETALTGLPRPAKKEQAPKPEPVRRTPQERRADRNKD
jgi:hypothetical protein